MSQTNIIVAGKGYSSDLQDVSPLICYNVTSLPITAAQSIVNLNSAMKFSDLQSSLQIDVSAKGKVGMFKAGVDVSYMRSVQDTDYSFSLNYYQSIVASVVLSASNYGTDILTSVGKDNYKNGTNPSFGLVCGDQLITSYSAGATLVLSVNLIFSNYQTKQLFSTKAGASYGSFASITASVQTTASQNSITGQIAINAFQIGGDPSQLSKILTQNSQGSYYAASCDITNTAACQGVITGLLNYATQTFPSQVSTSTGTGLSPLAIGLASFTPIERLGLNAPISWITASAEQSRVKLANAYYENKYYIEKFDAFLNKYPVAWDQTSNLYKNATAFYNVAKNNMDILLDSNSGAIMCYTQPENCVQIADSLLSSLTYITSNDLSFLKVMKYYVQAYTCGGASTFRRNGDTTNSLAREIHGGCDISAVNSVYLNDTQYSYSINVIDPWGETVTLHSNGYLNWDGNYYSGTTFNPGGAPQSTFVQFLRIVSEYYLDAYNSNTTVTTCLNGFSFCATPDQMLDSVSQIAIRKTQPYGVEGQQCVNTSQVIPTGFDAYNPNEYNLISSHSLSYAAAVGVGVVGGIVGGVCLGALASYIYYKTNILPQLLAVTNSALKHDGNVNVGEPSTIIKGALYIDDSQILPVIPDEFH